MTQTRRSFSSEFKFYILKEHLIDHKSIKDISLRYLIHPTVVHRWKNQFITKGVQVFEKRIKKIIKVQSKAVVMINA